MSEENSKGVLESLPSRPLSMAEADVIANKEMDGGGAMTPVSMMMFGNDAVCTVIMIASQKRERTYIVGYSPMDEGWEKIDSWGNEEWSIEKQDSAIENWADETFDENKVEHTFVDAY